MSAPSYIRRHINNLIGSKPFSIRDFLIYGPRNVVDQVFHRLLIEGRIIRVARGVYIKSTSAPPTLAEIVQVKAAGFGRIIAIHGSVAAQRLISKAKGKQAIVFASSGATTSFRVGRYIIRFVRASARKLQLGDHPAGLAIRALWHQGKRACNPESAKLVIAQFQPHDRRMLRLSAAAMPQWMRECFALLGRMDCLRRDLKPAFSS